MPIAPGSGVYDESGTRSPSGALKFAFATFRSVRARRDEDDCVMVSSTPALLVLAARMGLGPGRGTVLIVDWLEVWTRSQWQEYLGAGRGLLAWTVQGMAVWATPTATCHAALVEDRLRGIRPGLKVLRSPGLIDASKAEPVPDTGPACPPYALFVGRLIEDKNVLSIPAAIAAARRTAPDLRCIVVGAGPLLDDLHRRIGDLGLADAFTIRSDVTDEELAALMAGATCLLHPSRREGYGLVVVEAARLGTPAVVLNAPDNAATELIDEGVNGFLATSTASRDLGRGIAACLDGGIPLRVSTHEWHAQVRQTRSIQRTAERILDFLRAELAGRG
jgi:glycosyltransferase involved in cell wall biosynthesis